MCGKKVLQKHSSEWVAVMTMSAEAPPPPASTDLLEYLHKSGKLPATFLVRAQENR